MSQNVLEAVSAMAVRKGGDQILDQVQKRWWGRKCTMTDSVRKETAHDVFSR